MHASGLKAKPAIKKFESPEGEVENSINPNEELDQKSGSARIFLTNNSIEMQQAGSFEEKNYLTIPRKTGSKRSASPRRGSFSTLR